MPKRSRAATEFQVAPFEGLLDVIPRGLDGRFGANRGGNCVLGSNVDDYTAVLVWLNECQNPATLRSYTRVSESLLLWAVLQRQKALSSLDEEDLEAYVSFLEAPAPAEVWVGPSKPRGNPDWRPFARGLSPTSIVHSLAVLAAMFDFLKEQGCVVVNPVRVLSRTYRSSRDTSAQDRFLTEQEWSLVLHVSDRLDEFYGWHPRAAQRLRFIITFIHSTGLKISELASATLGDLKRDRKGSWTVTIQGEYGAGKVVVPALAFQALETYLLQRGISTSPQNWKSATPLVGRLVKGEETQSVSTAKISVVVADFFKLVAQILAPMHPSVADKAKKVRLFWLRHTHATHALANGVSALNVRDNLRHRSMNTMSRYFHPSDDNVRAEQLDKAFPIRSTK